MGTGHLSNLKHFQKWILMCELKYLAVIQPKIYLQQRGMCDDQPRKVVPSKILDSFVVHHQDHIMYSEIQFTPGLSKHIMWPALDQSQEVIRITWPAFIDQSGRSRKFIYRRTSTIVQLNWTIHYFTVHLHDTLHFDLFKIISCCWIKFCHLWGIKDGNRTSGTVACVTHP